MVVKAEKLLKKLPRRQPGVYLFFNSKREIIYVGKAKDLKSRVSQYFQNSKILAPAKQKMLDEIRNIDYLVVDSEEEALMLESILIKKYWPKYNIDLKDDKSQVFIEITKEDLPQVRIVREKVINAKPRINSGSRQGGLFGPYRTAYLARRVLSSAYRIFLQDKRNYLPGLDFKKYKKLVASREYLETIVKLKNFLRQDYKKLVYSLKKEMGALSQDENYEQAARTRDQLFALEDIKRQERLAKKLGLFRKEKEIIQALGQLKEVLALARLPQRIECYDISNIQGQYAVGSMVVFVDGEPDPDEYRKFKIRTVFKANDTAMMREVLSRRFRNNWPNPDLIVVDGGKGQLSAAQKVLEAMNKKISLVALAKREEELFLPGKKNSIKLPRRSSALKLVQRLRDEAHRFAISYYRSLHSPF